MVQEYKLKLLWQGRQRVQMTILVIPEGTMTWAATEAKAKFSEVLDKADSEGEQLVRRRKREYVVMTREQRDAYVAKARTESSPFRSAWDALGPDSGLKVDVEFPRSKSKGRKVKF